MTWDKTWPKPPKAGYFSQGLNAIRLQQATPTPELAITKLRTMSDWNGRPSISRIKNHGLRFRRSPALPIIKSDIKELKKILSVIPLASSKGLDGLIITPALGSTIIIHPLGSPNICKLKKNYHNNNNNNSKRRKKDINKLKLGQLFGQLKLIVKRESWFWRKI